jgi:hypothetical protein
MRSRHDLMIFLTMAAILLSGPGFTEATAFAAPSHKGHLLGWCQNQGSTCGSLAALISCKNRGANEVVSFKFAQGR